MSLLPFHHHVCLCSLPGLLPSHSPRTPPPHPFCSLLCIYFYCFCLLHQSTSSLALSSLASFPVSKSIIFYSMYRIKCLKCWFDPELCPQRFKGILSRGYSCRLCIQTHHLPVLRCVQLSQYVELKFQENLGETGNFLL